MSTYEIINISIQAVAFIALAIYVWKTWEMASATRKAAEASERSLQELKESRAQEVAPYVYVYFERPNDLAVIFLVIQNLGKSVARDIKFEFTPPLAVAGTALEKLHILENGLLSLPPGRDLKFLYGASSDFADDGSIPLTYTVKISYTGGMAKDNIVETQTLDLSMYKGGQVVSRKGLHELNERLERIDKTLNKISEAIGAPKPPVF